jgi:hypothetical protein
MRMSILYRSICERYSLAAGEASAPEAPYLLALARTFDRLAYWTNLDEERQLAEGRNAEEGDPSA